MIPKKANNWSTPDLQFDHSPYFCIKIFQNMMLRDWGEFFVKYWILQICVCSHLFVNALCKMSLNILCKIWIREMLKDGFNLVSKFETFQAASLCLTSSSNKGINLATNHGMVWTGSLVFPYPSLCYGVSLQLGLACVH